MSHYTVLDKFETLNSYGLRLLKCDCPLSIPEVIWVDKETHDSVIPGHRVHMKLSVVDCDGDTDRCRMGY